MKLPFIWALTILLAFFFINAGFRKISGNPATIGHFTAWGYRAWIVYLIAAVEFLGVLLMIFPKTTTIGTSMLVILMIGATYTLISHHVWKVAIFTTLALFLLLLLGYLRWSESWILDLLKGRQRY